MSRNLRELIPLGIVIASRPLSFDRTGHPAAPIIVEVGAPVPDPNFAGSFLCPIVISGFEKEEKLVLGGVDAIQALVFGLQALPAYLSLCARQYKGSLNWLGSSDLGFPALSS